MSNWRKRYDKLWLPSPKFKGSPEYKPAIKLCEEQKDFIAQELKRERDEILPALYRIRANTPFTKDFTGKLGMRKQLEELIEELESKK